MILHLADDEKFIDHVIDIFEEVAPNKNIYFIHVPNNSYKLQYIKSEHTGIITGSENCQRLKELLADTEKISFIIIHNLSPYKQKIISEDKFNRYFHWMCWGADLYLIKPLKDKIIKKNELIKDTNSFNKKTGDFIKRHFPSLWYNMYLKPKGISKPEQYKHSQSFEVYYKNIVSKIRSVSTVTPYEYLLIKKYLNKDIEYIPFKYATIENLISNPDDICSGENVFIGNSSSESNNHLFTLQILKKAVIEPNKIIMPLSYGNQEYRERVITEYRNCFNERFEPLLDFISLNDYAKKINSCSHFIMNHIRQQALGNVILALWKGGKVYMNLKSPIYKLLIANRIKIFKISQFPINNKKITSDYLAKINRPALYNIYNRNLVLLETRSLINRINDNKL